MIEKQIVNKLSTMDCDALGLLDAKTHQYVLKDIMSELEGPKVIGSGDFDERARQRLPQILLVKERDQVMEQFRVAYIIEQLEKQEIFSIVYSIRDDKNRIRRKRFRFCYLDDTKKLILYSRSDITDMYKKEQEQLRQTEDALDMAKHASDAKTEFFSRISHDMRTPMNGILGLAELSQEENDIAVLKENINKIQSSGQYLLGLINDTLDFQKIESGKLNLEPEVVDTQKLLNSITSMIANTAQEKGVSFRVINKNTELNWHVRVDPMRMKQIFINLLSNAVKFTPSGGAVEMGFECVGREGMISHNLITITDTGIGMSEKFLQNGIFKPFAQESNEVTNSYAGTGLGLSIAKQLIELMGGTISVESEQGVGTKVCVLCVFLKRKLSGADSGIAVSG